MSEQVAAQAAEPTIEANSQEESAQPETSGEIQASDNIQDAVEAAVENGASKKEIKDIIRTFELKVNGKNITKKINLSNEKELIRELQLAAAGREAMNETAELKKLFSQEIGRMKQDPWAVLEELGLNPDELAEMRIQQRIEEMKKSPEQIENEKMRKELDDARKKLKEREEKEADFSKRQFEDQIAKELDEQIIQTLDAHKDISASPKVVGRIAETMLWAMENGFDDVTPEDVIPTVKNELRKEINDLLSNLPEEFLEEYIGQKNVERMRKKRVDAAKQAKQVNTISNVKPKTNEVKKEEEPKKKRSLEDFMRLY
jgi:hypothetical protein